MIDKMPYFCYSSLFFDNERSPDICNYFIGCIRLGYATETRKNNCNEKGKEEDRDMRIVGFVLGVFNIALLYAAFRLQTVTFTTFVDAGGGYSMGFVIMPLVHFRWMSAWIFGIMGANALFAAVAAILQPRLKTVSR